MNDYETYCTYKKYQLNLTNVTKRINSLKSLNDYYKRLLTKGDYTKGAVIYVELICDSSDDEYIDSDSELIDGSHSNLNNENKEIKNRYRLNITKNIKATLDTDYACVINLFEETNKQCEPEKLYIYIKVLLLEYKCSDGLYLCDIDTLINIFNSAKSQASTYSFEKEIASLNVQRGNLNNNILSVSSVLNKYLKDTKSKKYKNTELKVHSNNDNVLRGSEVSVMSNLIFLVFLKIMSVLSKSLDHSVSQKLKKVSSTLQFN